MNLKATLLRAGAWTAGAYSVELVVRLVSNLILTRLLFPEAFGVVAASSSILIGLELISDFGVRAAIIQNPRGDSDTFLRSAWTFQISRGIILWLVVIVICGCLALPFTRAVIPAQSVFSSTMVAGLTMLLGFQFVIAGFESTAIPLNYRRMNYKPVVLLDLTSKIAPVPLTILCAWLYPSPFALAAGPLTASTLRVVLSHTIIPGPMMRWEWDTGCIQQLVHFGKWITVSSIATFGVSQSDVIFFGFLLPASFLGVYFIARTLVDAAEGLMERLNATLTLSVLGEVLRQNPLNLRDRFYRFRLPIDFVAATSGGFLVSAGTAIIGILYDPRYIQAGSVLEVLGLGLAIYPVQLIRSAFTAVGQTHVVATVSVIQAFAVVSFLITGFLISGPMGAVVGLVLSRLVPSAILFLLGRRKNWTSGWHELRLIPLFISGLLLGWLFLVLLQKFEHGSVLLTDRGAWESPLTASVNLLSSGSCRLSQGRGT